MSRLSWYWHRLRAMSPSEVAGHARKKFFQFVDERRERDWTAVKLESPGTFPKLPEPKDAPEALRQALKRDVENILAGRWKAFGHLDIKVDDPPLWHCDYLVGKDLATTESAFKLNHRELPGGADIKLIWELSRWYQLVRLAMAAYVLGDERAAQQCVSWLTDWVKHNPPYRGWNWTSALEVGMRLVQFTWIDGLLGARATVGIAPPSPRPSPPGEGGQAAAVGREGTTCQHTAAADLPLPGGEGRGEGERWQEELARLRYEILPAHVWFAWRYRSFGSSANNHLIGELAGLILATVRWPALAQWGAPLEELQRRWEHEVLAQFADDGGNKEQALNYQLFSWEFCWQARAALTNTGRPISPAVSERLYRAADFFVKMQVENEPWDYGDSDNAFVTPFYANSATAGHEWHQWLISRPHSPAIEFWLGPTREQFRSEVRKLIRLREEIGDEWLKPESLVLPPSDPQIAWVIYRKSGQAICRAGNWTLRLDFSPLGFLATAAHGHLDALHLSIWFKGMAMVVDPGTGAYYADKKLRSWLASREAHNGPCESSAPYPQRLGPFLWLSHHPVPTMAVEGARVVGEWRLPECPGEDFLFRRSIASLPDGAGWEVADELRILGQSDEFKVRWQFAPETRVKLLSERKFALHRGDISVSVEAGEEWAGVKLVETESDRGGDSPLAGIVSPAFRKTCFAPYLLLSAPGGDKPCVFRTTFLASGPS